MTSSCSQIPSMSTIRHAIPPNFWHAKLWSNFYRRKNRRSQACHIETRSRLVADFSKSFTTRKFVCDERIGAKSDWNRVVWTSHKEVCLRDMPQESWEISRLLTRKAGVRGFRNTPLGHLTCNLIGGYLCIIKESVSNLAIGQLFMWKGKGFRKRNWPNN